MRVAVADDSSLFREGLVELLTGAGLDVVLQVRTGDELVERLRESGPEPVDAAVVDLRMPPSHRNEGIETAIVLKSTWPTMGVLVLSTYAEPHYAARLLELDEPGVGYMLKDNVEDTAELVASLRRVAGGGTAVDPTLVRDLLRARPAGNALQGLSPRQFEVLALMARGLSNQAIADTLGVALRTAENHVSAVFMELGLSQPGDNRRVRAVLAYLRSTERPTGRGADRAGGKHLP